MTLESTPLPEGTVQRDVLLLPTLSFILIYLYKEAGKRLRVGWLGAEQGACQVPKSLGVSNRDDRRWLGQQGPGLGSRLIITSLATILWQTHPSQ